jgi:hypothetical protein
MTAMTIAGAVASLLCVLLALYEISHRLRLNKAARPLQDAVEALMRAQLAIEQITAPTVRRKKRLRRRDRVARSVPSWALGLMAEDDAQRYMWEWGAHLLQLIEEGEARQARRDRRRFAVTAITLAVVLRVRRALGRAR